MKLSLVVPCFNEENNVFPFYRAVEETFVPLGIEHEIIFVNDGSSDGTPEKLKALYRQAQSPVTVISFSRNFGKEAAMFAGLEHVKGDYVCLIDADLQQRPEVVAEMVRILDEEPDLDCVAAFQDQRSESAALRFFKDGFYKLINSVSTTRFTQGASDFRTFRRKVAESVISLGEYHRFSKGLLSWVGYNVRYIPYKAEERASGESKWSFKKLFKYAVEGIMAFSVAPLLLPLIIGLVMICASVLCFIGRAIIAALTYSDFGATQAVIITLLLCTGILLSCLGIVAMYLAKIYEQSKDRPIYIAKEILTPEDK